MALIAAVFMLRATKRQASATCRSTGPTGGSAAATLLILAAGLLAGFALVRDCGSARAGYALTGIAGLSAGVDAVAGPLLWPLLVGLGVWALHKGARWPLLAPVLFVAVWGGSALAAVACSAVPVTVGSPFAGLGALGAPAGGETWFVGDNGFIDRLR